MIFDYRKIQEQQKSVATIRKNIVEICTSKDMTSDFVSPVYQTNARTLKELKVAAIMDDFTFHCFQPECKLLLISPDNFEQEIKTFLPDLLFVESAWHGNHNLWENKLAYGSREYLALADFCGKRNIPIIFWNKEDPVHTKDFLVVAKTADFVFTTERGLIAQYREILGHDNIYHLHFAAQPQFHNPIEKYNRKDKFCFAGAYYRCYPERSRIFNKFADFFLAGKGLDIYDRECGNRKSVYRFPHKYTPYILGKLETDEIDKAYKGYLYGINMNTVTMAETMFARRVFELMASNTVVVGNYSKGLKNYFGELTVCTDSVDELKDKLKQYCSDKEGLRKYRLLGLRTVLSKHLYEDRLDEIVKKVFGSNLKEVLPGITVISQVANEKEYRFITEEFEKQVYENKKLIVLCPDTVVLQNCADTLALESGKQLLVSEKIQKGYIAYFHPEDYYAPYYLYDLIYTLRYCNADVIGKSAYYYFENGVKKYFADSVYRYVHSIEKRCAIINGDAVAGLTFDKFVDMESYMGKTVFCTDEFNYCQNTKGVCCNEVEV